MNLVLLHSRNMKTVHDKETCSDSEIVTHTQALKHSSKKPCLTQIYNELIHIS
jgi:hypothetical protein